jgi:uncharacterized protein involved in cysteine biosynthesis
MRSAAAGFSDRFRKAFVEPSGMTDFIRGIGSVFKAMKIIATDPRVRRLAIAPLAINIVLVIVGIPLLLWLGGEIGADLVPGSESWAAPLRVLLQIVATLVVAVVGIVVLLVAGRIIAAPMMTRLSEAVEQHVLGEGFTPRRTTLRDEVADVGRGVMFAIGRLLLFLLIYPPILLFGLIPGAGPIIVSILSFLYGALVLSLDFSEPVFERHLPGFRRRLRHVVSRPMLYLGFGGAAVAMALVPLANLAVLPVCVAAATLVFLGDARDDGRL